MTAATSRAYASGWSMAASSPKHFEQTLGDYASNGFGVEPRLTQTAFLRPHNRSEEVTNLYLVGQGT